MRPVEATANDRPACISVLHANTTGLGLTLPVLCSQADRATQPLCPAFANKQTNQKPLLLVTLSLVVTPLPPCPKLRCASECCAAMSCTGCSWSQSPWPLPFSMAVVSSGYICCPLGSLLSLLWSCARLRRMSGKMFVSFSCFRTL